MPGNHQLLSYINVLGKHIPVFSRGGGNIPLLVMGQSSLFKKPNFIPPELDNYFTIYFADIFEKPDLSDETRSRITLDDFIEAYEQIRLALHLDKIALFAHSAGGVLALEYAHKYANHVSFNIIVATAPIWGETKTKLASSYFDNNSTNERKGILAKDREIAPMPGESSFVHAYQARRAQFYYLPMRPSWLRLWDGINQDEGLVMHFFNLIQNYDVLGGTPKSPTFLALGLHDFSNPFYLWADKLSGENSHFVYHIFERSGHYPTIEEPKVFVGKMLDFTSRVSGLTNYKSVKPLMTFPSRSLTPGLQ